MQAELLSSVTELLVVHVMPRCRLRDILALGHSTSALRALVGSLSESTLQTAARRSLPPQHPVCLSSDVRGALLKHQRLEASMLRPETWRSGFTGIHSLRSPDFQRSATFSGEAVHLQDLASKRAVSRTHLPAGNSRDTPSTQLAFSPDSRTLAILFFDESRPRPGTALCKLGLLPVRGTADQLRVLDLGCLDAIHMYASEGPTLSWAPCSSMLCACLGAESRQLRACTKLVVCSVLGTVLACLDAPSHYLMRHAAWSPCSRFVMSGPLGPRSDSHEYHLLDLPASQWHARKLGAAVSWLHAPASTPQMLVSVADRYFVTASRCVSLVAAPTLEVVCTQRMSFAVQQCVCGHGVVALVGDNQKRVELHRLVSQPESDGVFLQLLHAVSANHVQAAWSPTGRVAAVLVVDPACHEPRRVKLFNVHTDAVLLGSIALPVYGRLQWSSDACSILVNQQCLVRLGGE